MRIVKDGSVFRISLDSSCGEFETRISFAASSHEHVGRPRLEVGQKSLTALFMQILPHMTATGLVSDKEWDPSVRNRNVEELFRVLDEIAQKEMVERRKTQIHGLGFDTATSKLLEAWSAVQSAKKSPA